ncbi:cadherin-related family member 5-like [Dioscorea cayenensis subsp. rotundata]|uniref:Cadherin-related family member 5-like n=1 Tax=Dioscorea cayennensis subsp. rotundata TaxID=55577 RepID=A0AB40CK99_DIOCR|nr:cadherin-related family member 5-like [Dioscorea cayenensis subsp. rotundata]
MALAPCRWNPMNWKAKVSQPSRNLREKEVSLDPLPMDAGTSVRDPIPPSSVSSDGALFVPDNSVSDSDFGPWLLVSRRRGQPRSRGGGARTPNVNVGTAAAPSNDDRSSRGVPVRGTRGGLRGGSSGRRPSPRPTLHDSPSLQNTVLSANPYTPDIVDPSVALSITPWDPNTLHPEAPRDPSTSTMLPSPVISHSTLENPPTDTLPRTPTHTAKEMLTRRHPSPPPVLLTTSSANPSIKPHSPNPEHSKLVS